MIFFDFFSWEGLFYFYFYFQKEKNEKKENPKKFRN